MDTFFVYFTYCGEKAFLNHTIYSIFRRRRRWSSTTRCSIDGDTRALKLPFKIRTVVRDWFWKHEKSIGFSLLISYVFDFCKCYKFQKLLHIFGELITSYHFSWTVHTIVHWCPRYYERGRLSQIFLSVCVVFSFWFAHQLIDTTRKCKCHKMFNFTPYFENMYYFNFLVTSIFSLISIKEIS